MFIRICGLRRLGKRHHWLRSHDLPALFAPFSAQGDLVIVDNFDRIGAIKQAKGRPKIMRLKAKSESPRREERQEDTYLRRMPLSDGLPGPGIKKRGLRVLSASLARFAFARGMAPVVFSAGPTLSVAPSPETLSREPKFFSKPRSSERGRHIEQGSSDIEIAMVCTDPHSQPLSLASGPWALGKIWLRLVGVPECVRLRFRKTHAERACRRGGADASARVRCSKTIFPRTPSSHSIGASNLVVSVRSLTCPTRGPAHL
jgi:hypothetical protein